MREGARTIEAPDAAHVVDAREAVELLLRDLQTGPAGLSSREVERRLVAYGRNELVRRGGRRWPRELAKQVTHPLALLLWVGAAPRRSRRHAGARRRRSSP